MNTEALKFLIIENDKNTLRLLSAFSEAYYQPSIKLMCSGNIDEAVRIIKNDQTDLVILNPNIDGNKGFLIFEYLRNNIISIPVITLIQSEDFETGKNTLKLGAQDFLFVKDLTTEKFLHSAICAIERYKYSRPLIEIEEKFQMTVHHSPVTLYRQDKDLKYTWLFSPGFDLNSEDIVGKSDNDLLPFEDAFILSEIKKRVLATGTEIRKTFKTNIHGEIHYFDLRIEPIYNLNGEVEGIKGAALDITERKRIEKEFMRAKSLLEKIFFSLSESVFVYNLSGKRILTCNPAVQKIFGYSPQEIIGKSMQILHLEHKDFDYFETIIDEALSKKGFYFCEYKMKRKDGKIIDTEQRITLLKKSKGWDEMVVAVINDITDKKQIEQVLIRAKENAEKSDQLKTEFLAQMSHEIRTPINIILSYTSHLQDELTGSLSDDFKPSFRAIDKAGKRIIRTIDLILNMSEIMTGNYDMKERNIDLYLDILLNLYIEFKKYAFEKNLELNIHKLTGNTEIVGDEHSVYQIFLQLIDNAVKYTNNGRIDIRLTRNIENKLVVEIEDTGIGMAPDYFQKIFEPFSQENQGSKRLFEGIGLGLALVKKYCELNNAEIRVDSKPEIGTKFLIIFTTG